MGGGGPSGGGMGLGSFCGCSVADSGSPPRRAGIDSRMGTPLPSPIPESTAARPGLAAFWFLIRSRPLPLVRAGRVSARWRSLGALAEFATPAVRELPAQPQERPREQPERDERER